MKVAEEPAEEKLMEEEPVEEDQGVTRTALSLCSNSERD
jgi:hypothetical protein